MDDLNYYTTDNLLELSYEISRYYLQAFSIALQLHNISTWIQPSVGFRNLKMSGPRLRRDTGAFYGPHGLVKCSSRALFFQFSSRSFNLRVDTRQFLLNLFMKDWAETGRLRTARGGDWRQSITNFAQVNGPPKNRFLPPVSKPNRRQASKSHQTFIFW